MQPQVAKKERREAEDQVLPVETGPKDRQGNSVAISGMCRAGFIFFFGWKKHGEGIIRRRRQRCQKCNQMWGEPVKSVCK